MRSIYRIGRRPARLTTLCVAFALVTAATATAYPVTPEGEPLHVAGAQPTSSLPPEGISVPPDVGSTTSTSTTTQPVPATVRASSDTDWLGGLSVAAASGLAALGVIAGAFVLIGRRRSVGAH